MKVFGSDAYSPREIAERVAEVGVGKARLPALATFMLAMCGGGFIGLGALYYVVVVSDPAVSFAIARVLGGLVFSLGLILVIVAGAELFTGNNLLVMAWADGRISVHDVLRNWSIVYAGNAFGALGLAVVVYLANHGSMNSGAVGEAYIRIAAAKAALPFAEAFFKGVLCNLLVCLAVWLAMAGHTVVDKVVAIVFPISAFVAAGLEHSVANLYFMSVGVFLQQATASGVSSLHATSILGNLVAVTLGNIAGGSLMVAGVYWLIYRRAMRIGSEEGPVGEEAEGEAALRPESR